MGRIQNAEGDLLARQAQLKAIMEEMSSQRAELEAHHERLRELIEGEPERSRA